MKETKVVLDLKTELDKVRQELTNLKADHAVLQEKLAQEVNAGLNYAAEVGLQIGGMHQEIELQKKLASGFSAALMKEEAENEDLKTKLEIAERDRDFFDTERMKVVLELEGLQKVIADREDLISSYKINMDEYAAALKQSGAELQHFRKVMIDREPLKNFDAAWAKMEAQGYQYGEEALDQVRFGWYLAQETLAEWRKNQL